MGSDGGLGGHGFTGTNGTAGSGGGAFRVYSAGNVTINSGGAINANGSGGGNGTAGGAYPAGGSGGGSGGYVGVYSHGAISVAATAGITANGGNGGSADQAAGGAGGGGGGGVVVLMSTTAPSITGTVTVAAGTGGATGVAAGAAGAGVTTSITGTPNLPLIAHLENTPAEWIAITAARFRHNNYLEHLDLKQTAREVCDLQAAWNCKPGKFNDLRMALYFGGKDEQQIGEMSYMQVKPHQGINNPFGEQAWLETPTEQCIIQDDTREGRI